MALTYTLTTPANKLVFKKEKSYFATIVAVAGGLLFAFGGLAIPVIALKVLVFLSGIGFSVAALYLPSLNDRFVPEQVTFDLPGQSITFEMIHGGGFQIPINNVRGFFIDTEKRSSSAANSVGVHYLHHHINLKRYNEACWTVTTTTDVEEAKRTIQMLNELFNQPVSPMPAVELELTSKIQIEKGEPIVMKWQEKTYALTIHRNKLEHTEYKSNGDKIKTREFHLLKFKRVQYSYSAATKNKNWTIMISFGDLPQEQLNLYFRDLNPVECLQVECWLQQTIQKKLSL